VRLARPQYRWRVWDTNLFASEGAHLTLGLEQKPSNKDAMESLLNALLSRDSKAHDRLPIEVREWALEMHDTLVIASMEVAELGLER
jgi:hypothetical protein